MISKINWLCHFGGGRVIGRVQIHKHFSFNRGARFIYVMGIHVQGSIGRNHQHDIVGESKIRIRSLCAGNIGMIGHGQHVKNIIAAIGVADVANNIFNMLPMAYHTYVSGTQ
ncbi:MAG: hypothetical protein ACKO1F_04035, partial [Flammeovirgaceae bacterium]